MIPHLVKLTVLTTTEGHLPKSKRNISILAGNTEIQSGVGHMLLTPALGRQKQVGLCLNSEFLDSQGY